MEEESTLKYMAIPGEVCQLVDINDELLNISDKVTCIIFVSDNIKESVNKALYVRNNLKKKTALFSTRNSLPFRSEVFNYIKLNNILMMNLSDDINAFKSQYIDITSELTKPLDILDPYYFDKLKELENNE